MIFVNVDREQLDVIKDALHIAAQYARSSANFYDDMLMDYKSGDTVCTEQCRKFASEWRKKSSNYQKVLNLLVKMK